MEAVKDEIEYYKRIAQRAGELRLRETERLWQTIALKEQAETALKAARDELEERVATRTAELVQANELLRKEALERKKVMDRLAESETKYRAMFDDSLEAMTLTQEGVILDVNSAWLKLFGCLSSNIVTGKSLAKILFEEDEDPLVKDAILFPTESESVRVFSVRAKRCDGTPLDMEVYSTRIFIGGEVAVLTTIRDITEKKRIEKEKVQLENRLRQSEKMEAIGLLAGGVAHDLNNILGAIIVYPELLLLDLPENSPLAETVIDIKKAGEKAAAIVKDLLALARRGVKTFTAVNLNRLINDYLNSPEYKRLLKFHEKVTVKTRPAEDLMCMKGSPVHLYQVIMNVVSNAAEAISGEGTVIISTENRIVGPGDIDKHGLKEGAYIVLKIQDTGMGISEEEKAHIFEPFFTKKVMGRSGTGLGMTVVLGTVQDHGGHIDIESAVGHGTVLTIWFSASKECVEGEKERRGIDAWVGNGESILVIDDVLEQRAIATEMLTRLGYKVTAFSSGEEATEYLLHHRADLVLIDMIMDPGIDGYETYRRILEIHPGQKAILMSGYSESSRVQLTLELGAGAYLSKPYSVSEMGATICRILSTVK